MKDYCRSEYPEESNNIKFLENCALAHVNEHACFDCHGRAFVDFTDMPWAHNLHQSMENASEALLWIGILLYLTGYKFQQNTVLLFVVLVNFSLSLPYVSEISNRYGVDYVAYI